ncbi:MAG: tRNA (guanosine(46)-N7)-methyltransferase TrmB [Peptococcaceae bacterium]|jgi:tRNA (guanine-N7-)-methyltransferase|nr:tRNA (guanosine(46)-N7)-methyltransferase TrmB [Peptococcaceae bacterium]
MRLRKKPDIHEKIRTLPGIVSLAEGEQPEGWERIFGKKGLLHVEIGMGKGAFITQMARRRPDVHFVGVERVADILYTAARGNVENPLPNLRFLVMDGADLAFGFKEGEVQRIYLNFSDPWPKRRHAGRRLTHRRFLEIYRRILSPLGEIHFRTDDGNFFEFSLKELAASGYSVSKITRDWRHEDDPDMAATEYEARFREMGRPICRLEAYAPLGTGAAPFRRPESFRRAES